MPRPAVFPCDTTLYHPVEGKKVFPAGETDPGPAWSDKPGGEPVGKGATAQAMKDLIEAQDQIDQLGAQLASKDHDLAQMAAERDEAVGKLAAAEQRARDAEEAKAEAEKVAAEVTGERDRVAAVETELRGKIAALEVEAEKVPGLVEQLNTANQTIADQKATIEAQAAEIAKVDGDKDGKVGGSKAKGGL